MDAIKQSVQELALHFNNTMAEFQQNLSSSIPATSPTSNIASQFSVFRTFVLSALENLQLQVEHLSKQQDRLDMNSRKKILLVHGVPEGKNEDISAVVTMSLSDRLGMADLSVEDMSRCHRMGGPKGGKHRPILLKFKQLSLRKQVWDAKSKLKGTGVTLSEFLTKDRHDTFMAARQRFGINKCWTNEGVIFAIGSDGSRHRLTSKAELENIVGISDVPSSVGSRSAAYPGPSSAITAAPQRTKPTQPIQTSRAKRNIKK